jgi:hypothetical protein
MRSSSLLLPILAAACSGDPDVFADAGADAPSTDAPSTDAPVGVDGPGERGPVTVHVLTQAGDGLPDLAATVYVADPDGTVVSQAMPDAGGVVNATVAEGGSVTVWHGGGNVPVLTTVYAVGIGDELWFGFSGSQPVTTMTVALPAAAGSTRYNLRGPCVSGEGDTPTLTVRLVPGCAATVNLLAMASGGTAPVRYIVVPAVTPAAGTTLTVSDPWAAPPSVAWTASGIPTGATSVHASITLIEDARITLGVVATSTPGEPLGLTTGLPAYGDGALLDVSYRSNVYYHDVRHVSPVPASAAVTVAPRVPAMTSLDLGPTTSWTLAGPGTPDLIAIDADELGDKGELLGSWRFLVPPDPSSVRVPVIAGAPSPGDARARVFDTDVVPDYAALRERVGLGEWAGLMPPSAPPFAQQSSQY